MSFRTEHGKIALRTFKKGLQKPLRTLNKASRDDNLKETITMAIYEEPYAKRHSYSKENATDIYQKTPLKNPEASCYRCGRTGHTYEHCYAKIGLQPDQVKNEPISCKY